METQLVSVICLCYNHAPFVSEAIMSVLQQTHSSVELIVVDDASDDESVSVIRRLISEYPNIKFIAHEKNRGNCAAFNHGLSLATGKFIIDLAADDVLAPNRIAMGLAALDQSGPDYGVHFSDAEWIDAEGKHLRNQSDRFPHNTIPQGDIYVHLIEKYFICSPSMMFRRSVIDSLGGYDESLAYEDFDFWIRSSRSFKYCYTPEVLVKKRVVENSMSVRQFTSDMRQQRSTYIVCEKIKSLNKSPDEQRALSRRIQYEIGVSLRLLEFRQAIRYFGLWLRNL